MPKSMVGFTQIIGSRLEIIMGGQFHHNNHIDCKRN
jgi:hypothetical protein